MKLRQLKIKNLRGYEEATLEFDKRFTLLVGINGVGKTTVLDALKVCLSHIMKKFTDSERSKEYFSNEDIKFGSRVIELHLRFLIYKKSYSMNVHKKLQDPIDERNIPSSAKRQKFKYSYVRPDTRSRKMNSSDSQPIAVYFSTKRSVSQAKMRKKVKAKNTRSLAHFDSLSGHLANLKDIAYWVRDEVEPTKNTFPHMPVGLRSDALQKAISTFLPGFKNLQAAGPNPILFIEKRGTKLSVNQLSHGERSILVFALDLARRLSLANPQDLDPLRNGAGVVLIDELELHIHPKWQRKIVKRLCKTFPRCQFIATTHSPLVIGEVHPKQIVLIEDGSIFMPHRSYGADTNQVLKEVMDTPSRKQKIEKKLKKVFRLIKDRKYEKAKMEILKLENKVGKKDPDIIRARTRLSLRGMES